MAKQQFENPSNTSQTIPIRTANSQREIAARQRKKKKTQEQKKLEELSKPTAVDRVKSAESVRKSRAQLSGQRADRLDRSRLIAKLRAEGDTQQVNQLLAVQRGSKRASDTQARQTAGEARLGRRTVGDIPADQQQANFNSLESQRKTVIEGQIKEAKEKLKSATDPDEIRSILQSLQSADQRLRDTPVFTPRTPGGPDPREDATRQRILERQGQSAVEAELQRQRLATGAAIQSSELGVQRNVAQQRSTESGLAARLGQATEDTRFDTGVAGAEGERVRAQIALQQAQEDAANQPDDFDAQRRLAEAENNARIAQANLATGTATREESRGAAAQPGQLEIDEQTRQQILEQETQETGISDVERAGFSLDTEIGVQSASNVLNSIDDLVSIRGTVRNDESKSKLNNAIQTVNRGLATSTNKAEYAKFILAQLEQNITDQRGVSQIGLRPSLLPEGGRDIIAHIAQKQQKKYSVFIKGLQNIAEGK